MALIPLAHAALHLFPHEVAALGRSERTALHRFGHGVGGGTLSGSGRLGVARHGRLVGENLFQLFVRGERTVDVAIVRVAAYVTEYIAKSVAGDIPGAARSLARGLAVGAIELIFALLFNLGDESRRSEAACVAPSRRWSAVGTPARSLDVHRLRITQATSKRAKLLAVATSAGGVNASS